LALDDPQAGRLRAAAVAAPDAPALCQAIFAMQDIVPPALAASAQFREEVVAALASLSQHGTRQALLRAMQI
jgi:fructuronate reductase